MSTFHGLEMARQALSTQQSALYTTGHNIANANTEGYSRQRVNFETASPYPAASRNHPEIPGQMGTGVQVGSVQRIRNEFLDNQYRAENSNTGYWETKANALGRMERLMNEPSENGLSSTMDQFWQSLQDLSVTPENAGARSVVAQRGLAVAENFNYLSESLTSIHSDLQNQMDVKVQEANILLHQINSINEQVKQIESHGNVANDLYDKRDRLIDDLSNSFNIKVSYSKSSSSSLDIADGLATIELVNDNGKSFREPVILLDGNLGLEAGEGSKVNELAVSESGKVTAGGQTIDIMESKGSLKGLIESSNMYTEMLTGLDDMASVFAEAFNSVHSEGYNLEGNNGLQFFEFTGDAGAAGSITVSLDLINNPEKIAASTDGNAGNGDNATALADIFNKALENDPLGNDNSVNGFYQSLIGELGVNAQEANRMVDNTNILKNQVVNQRMSVSAVSLDEEMSNMIKFQHAYNAAARSMTQTDELLDTIINNMGLVGR
ncbi:flagellar hook-associated protein FlgK [Virgibacillus sp. NKC19-16]|uniref:flagellar hook-associated protein FlgK n=1 Tax=Virgibacillus salidurans TaxID=2831673 RepID=UPI001F2CCBDA|nr:flagellar hook-associated protein FlgK [Virgibacillus sp. NKC19-16]UJL45344.1 flagellar hook-associated protein FlgK [Virgibacillus sp. NKC19-16]